MAKFLDQDGLSHLLSKLDDRYATIDHVDSSLQDINSSISTIQTNINSLQKFCDYKSQSYVNASIGGTPPENNIETDKGSFSIRELKLPSSSFLTSLSYNLKIGPVIQYAPSGNGYIDNLPFGPGLLIIRFYDSSTTNPTWKNKTVTITCANTDSVMGRHSECRFVGDQTTLLSSGSRLNYCETIEASQITVTGINNTSSSNVRKNSMLLCHMFGYPGDLGLTYVRVIPVNCKVQYPVVLQTT